MNTHELQKRAAQKLRQIEKARKDPRFVETLGVLVGEGHLDAPRTIPLAGPILLEDALWAGQWEPRILELLPALFLKKPRLFIKRTPLPDDFRAVLHAIKKGQDLPVFRTVEPRDYMPWVYRIGHRGKKPSVSKTFRFNENDLRTLQSLCVQTKKNETAVIREALNSLRRSLR